MDALTVITPVHPAHITQLERAVDSVNAQTIPVEHRVMIDEYEQGAGYIRNRLLEQVRTPFVTFLDADDWLEPDFAEVCLRDMPANGYVYTDWFENDRVVQAPFRAWCGGTWHLVTAVLRTDDARRVGGFDEHLNALEDTEFYLKLSTTFICGMRVKRPLVHYHFNPNGRSQVARRNGVEAAIKKQLLERYGGLMGCCGDAKPDMGPVGERHDGDVLAMALWRGNRKQVGVVSRRMYKYMSYPMTAWVDPRDIAKSPRLWREVDVPTLQALPPVMNGNGTSLNGIAALSHTLREGGVIGEPAPLANVGEYSPDYDYVIDTAAGLLK